MPRPGRRGGRPRTSRVELRDPSPPVGQPEPACRSVLDVVGRGEGLVHARILGPGGLRGVAHARMHGQTKEVVGGGSRGDRRLRRIGVLHAARRRPRGEGRHALRPAVRQRVPGHGRGSPGRVPAPARTAPHDPAAQDQLPRQRLGDALAGREGRHQPLRRRAPSSCTSSPATSSSATSSSTGRAGRADTFFDGPIVSHVSSAETYDPTLRRIALDVIREHGITVHDGGTVVVIQGPAVLDQGRVEVVQRRRLAGHQHDPVPRGLPVPRARDGGRQHRPDHRLRRRRARGHRGRHRPRRARGVRAERGADPQPWCWT